MKEIPDSAFILEADLVLLAMGFVAPIYEGLLEKLGVKLDGRGNVAANVKDYKILARQGLRLRRHAPRPIARRLGDPRGPSNGAVGRYIPDGLKRPAALEQRERALHRLSHLRDDRGGILRGQRRAEGEDDDQTLQIVTAVTQGQKPRMPNPPSISPSAEMIHIPPNHGSSQAI